MSINKVILVGNVGKDPDIKYFDNGSAVANFPLATTERGYTAANGTQIPDRTEWHNIVCWRGLAKVVEQFVRKGSQLYIEGKIRSRSYDDQNGIKRYVYEIFVDTLEIVGKRNETTANQGGYTPAANQQQASYGQSTGQTQANSTNPSVSPFASDDDADDLPF